jgi:L-malate glycosyltransferase
MYRQRIIAVHLLNDLSGSPFVFSQALQALVRQGYEVHLFTSDTSGFLSGLPYITYHRTPYRWSRYKWITLALYLISQCRLFFQILFKARKEDIVYVNSILPFGAAIAGMARGCRIVYHVHEVSIRPVLLKKMLLRMAGAAAHLCVFVSQYCKDHTALAIGGRVIYNALPLEFTRSVPQPPRTCREPFTVLMLCSLKKYKGVYQFIASAAALPGIRFELVLNADAAAIDVFFQDVQMPFNLFVFPAQENIHPFYQRSSVIVNLSLPDGWIETFGMTILEGMFYGRPVIVPPVGGVTELVQDGVEGLHVDSRRIEDLVTAITLLMEDEGIYRRMSRAAYRKARCFSSKLFEQQIEATFHGLRKHHHLNHKPKIAAL